MKWIKASKTLPQHMVRHALKINGLYYGGYYDYSIKAFMCPNMGPSGVPVKDVEWLNEDDQPMNSDIKPDFEKLADLEYNDTKFPYRMAKRKAYARGCESIWTDHVEPLLSTVKRLQEENERYKSALNKIVNPIHYLQEEAKKQDASLNGMMAIQLSRDHEWLRSIALKALESSVK